MKKQTNATSYVGHAGVYKNPSTATISTNHTNSKSQEIINYHTPEYSSINLILICRYSLKQLTMDSKISITKFLLLLIVMVISSLSLNYSKVEAAGRPYLFPPPVNSFLSIDQALPKGQDPPSGTSPCTNDPNRRPGKMSPRDTKLKL